jgi:hypothetical protein
MNNFFGLKRFLFTASSSTSTTNSSLSQTILKASEMIEFQAPFIASIDNGTTSTRFIVFDSKGRVVEVAQKEYPQYYPQAGWAEHDLEEIYTFTK